MIKGNHVNYHLKESSVSSLRGLRESGLQSFVEKNVGVSRAYISLSNGSDFFIIDSIPLVIMIGECHIMPALFLV